MPDLSIAEMVLGFAGTLTVAVFSYALNSFRGAIDSLRKQDKDLSERIQRVELLVTGDYVKKADLYRLQDAIFERFDKFEAKLDAKADR